jgi:hypothetical protein
MPFQDLGTRGYWNAATNFPPIRSGRGENGASHQVSVAGSTEIDGISDWRVGDIIFFMNDTWSRIPGRLTTAAYGGSCGGLSFIIDGGGQVITTGYKGHFKIPCGYTIESWELSADRAGSLVVDIWKVSLADFPPTVANSIVASAKPTLSSEVKASSAILTGWNTSILANDYLAFSVDSASSVQSATLVLNIERGET